MATAGYDPKKAELYNKLRKTGISEDQAWTQAGITPAEEFNYVVNDSPYNNDGSKNLNRGEMGAHIFGGGTKSFTPFTAAEKAESDAYYKSLESSNFEQVDYPVKASSQPSTKTPINYTTTSTEQVSGGGEKTIISGQPTPSAASRALQPSIDAKQAEMDQFVKDNPSNFARSKQGLPPLSPEDTAARQAKFRELSQEKTALKNEQFDAQNPGVTTIIEKPNTTTNTSTTTFGTSSTNTNVEAPDSQDEALSQQEEERLDAQPGTVTGGGSNTRTVGVNADGTIVQGSFRETVQTNTPANVNVIPGGGQITDPNAPDYNANAAEFARDREEFVQNDAPAAARDPFSITPRSLEPGVENSSAADVSASQDSALLTPAQSIARAQTTAPADVPPANTGVFANPNFSPEAVSGVNAPVDPATDPGVKSPFGGAASNAAAAQNPEAAAAALQQEQANQAAAMKLKAQEQAAIQAQFQSPASGDWRVRLRLAPSAKYLYMDDNNTLLKPLKASNGVVFPYMPTIQTTYNASYDSVELTHSNYRGQFYKSSYVGDVSITGVFTAQDTAEANYLLAVIHFFRSVTKMFYGAKDPLRGAPPPLVYLIGLGQYQFNNQPCVVKTFNYSMPNDCDYIRTKPNNYNTNLGGRGTKPQASTDPISTVINRLKNAALPQGAVPNVPAQGLLEMQSVTNIADSTYVPTKCEIQLTLMPIQTRSQQSQQFSMEAFANGNLLKGGFW
jgi:hypothetical protein